MKVKDREHKTIVYMQLTMCPQPKAMSFTLVRQIGQACIEEGEG